MKKISSSLQNMAMVLVGFALLTGGLLAFVNHITEGPIKAQAQATLSQGIEQVMGTSELKVVSSDTVKQETDGKTSTLVVHKTADNSGTPLGAAVESTTQGFGGDLKVLVGISPEGNVLGYTILQTSETPGLGAKADTWFLKNNKGDIIGKNPVNDNLTVKKDGGTVDAITAATITSRAFLKAIVQAYEASQNPKADAHSSASMVKH